MIARGARYITATKCLISLSSAPLTTGFLSPSTPLEPEVRTPAHSSLKVQTVAFSLLRATSQIHFFFLKKIY
jgi:hypothetical protein